MKGEVHMSEMLSENDPRYQRLQRRIIQSFHSNPGYVTRLLCRLDRLGDRMHNAILGHVVRSLRRELLREYSHSLALSGPVAAPGAESEGAAIPSVSLTSDFSPRKGAGAATPRRGVGFLVQKP